MKNLKPLSKAEMKKVVGGGGIGSLCTGGSNDCAAGLSCQNGVCLPYNPNCGPTNPVADWTCCEVGQVSHIGVMDCESASERCSGYKLTNDPSRC